MPILLYCGRFEVHFDGFSVFLDHNEHPKQHETLLVPFRRSKVEVSDPYIFDPQKRQFSAKLQAKWDP